MYRSTMYSTTTATVWTFSLYLEALLTNAPQAANKTKRLHFVYMKRDFFFFCVICMAFHVRSDVVRLVHEGVIQPFYKGHTSGITSTAVRRMYCDRFRVFFANMPLKQQTFPCSPGP